MAQEQDAERALRVAADAAVAAGRPLSPPKTVDHAGLKAVKIAEHAAASRANVQALARGKAIEAAGLPDQVSRLVKAVGAAWAEAKTARTSDAFLAWRALWTALEQVRLVADPAAHRVQGIGPDLRVVLDGLEALDRLLSDDARAELFDGTYAVAAAPSGVPIWLRRAWALSSSQSDGLRLVDLEHSEAWRTSAYSWRERFALPGIAWATVAEPAPGVPRRP